MHKDAAFWSAIAAVGAVCTAAVNLLVGALLTRPLARTQIKVADFNNCTELAKDIAEAQRRVIDARDDDTKHEFEFRELLNFMETLAYLVNTKNITASGEWAATHFLEETLAWVEVDKWMREFMISSVTGAETFKELFEFRRRHLARIQTLAEGYAGAAATPTP
jgi:hypothetical protein